MSTATSMRTTAPTTVALMQYMVNHNAAHARELEALAKKLG